MKLVFSYFRHIYVSTVDAKRNYEMTGQQRSDAIGETRMMTIFCLYYCMNVVIVTVRFYRIMRQAAFCCGEGNTRICSTQR